MLDAFQEILNRGLATKYGMKGSEAALGPSGRCAWDDSWELYDRFVLGAPHHLKAAQKNYVEASWAPFHRAQKGLAPGGGLGHRKLLQRPNDRKYVVFSDHHITFEGHRHFGCWGGNINLYCTALQSYLAGGYTLVENGDVEELVIFEPDVKYAHAQPEAKVRAALTKLSDLEARREVARKIQLQMILADPKHDVLIDLWKDFATARHGTTNDSRLIRVAGNHDYELQSASGFLGLYHSAGVPLDEPVDYLLIGEGEKRPFLVMHGHQFDKASNPSSAPRFGETISECLGLYYQGPDRTWSSEDTKVWRDGQANFLNDLVSDDPGPLAVSLDATLFEALFQHNIAWDYFEHRTNPSRAMKEEVLAGKRWIKFRHMDERYIWRHLNNYQKRKRPRLVLGHSHEVRAHPRRPGPPAKIVDEYFNSGSAGRFEKLVWGLEIVGDIATAVSWSQLDDGTIERREWGPDKDFFPGLVGKHGVLVPGATSGHNVP